MKNLGMSNGKCATAGATVSCGFRVNVTYTAEAQPCVSGPVAYDMSGFKMKPVLLRLYTMSELHCIYHVDLSTIPRHVLFTLYGLKNWAETYGIWIPITWICAIGCSLISF